jgi:hypothetical protein
MRTEVITRNLYTFAELSESAQQRAIEKLWDLNVDYAWYESTYETIQTAGQCMGIDCTVKGFDLDRGQSIDLRGRYTYRKAWRAALAHEFGGDTLAELGGIGEELQKVQRRAFYLASAELRRPYMFDGTRYDVDRDIGADVTDDLTDALRSFEHWAWRLLRDEYEYLTSAEAIKEMIEANKYEFDEAGNLA